MAITRKRRVEEFMRSEIRNMSIECDKVKGINLSQGICDLPLPQILTEGMQEAVSLGYNHYTRYDGISYLRNEIAKKAWEYNHIVCDPDKNITVSNGATGALYCVCYSLFNARDEIIMFTPFYGYHEYTLVSLDLKPVFVKLKEGSWEIDFGVLEAAVTKDTKAILISNPANPCGKIFTEEEFKILGEICNKYDLYFISDEIYEYITFDGKRHFSPASLKCLADRTITISGYSKTYSITGWRIGYSVAGEEIAKAIGCVNDLLYVCAPSPAQYAVAKAMENLGMDFYQRLREGYGKKRDLLCETLKQCKLTPYIPEGAYYVLADVSRLPGDSSKEKAMYLLRETAIGTVPGSAFYNDLSGEHMVRFCFARDIAVIERACWMLEKNRHKW